MRSNDDVPQIFVKTSEVCALVSSLNNDYVLLIIHLNQSVSIITLRMFLHVLPFHYLESLCTNTTQTQRTQVTTKAACRQFSTTTTARNLGIATFIQIDLLSSMMFKDNSLSCLDSLDDDGHHHHLSKNPDYFRKRSIITFSPPSSPVPVPQS